MHCGRRWKALSGHQHSDLDTLTMESVMITHMVRNYALQNTVTILSMMCTTPEYTYYVTHWQQPLQGIDVQCLCIVCYDICVKSATMVEVLHQMYHNDLIHTGLDGQMPFFLSIISIKHSPITTAIWCPTCPDMTTMPTVSISTLKSWEYLHFIKINKQSESETYRHASHRQCCGWPQAGDRFLKVSHL